MMVPLGPALPVCARGSSSMQAESLLLRAWSGATSCPLGPLGADRGADTREVVQKTVGPAAWASALLGAGCLPPQPPSLPWATGSLIALAIPAFIRWGINSPRTWHRVFMTIPC